MDERAIYPQKGTNPTSRKDLSLTPSTRIAANRSKKQREKEKNVAKTSCFKHSLSSYRDTKPHMLHKLQNFVRPCFLSQMQHFLNKCLTKLGHSNSFSLQPTVKDHMAALFNIILVIIITGLLLVGAFGHERMQAVTVY